MAWLVQLSLLALLGSAASLRAPASAAPGKIFFLMMADDSIIWEEIWARYFSKAERGVAFEAFLHCVSHDSCKEKVKHQDLFTIVPTVPSTYCDDLVSPMLALLRAATKRSDGNPYDKFVFVSSDSVPIKSFRTTQRMLIEGQKDMAFLGVAEVDKCKFMKAGQWMALSNWHAAHMLRAANTSEFKTAWPTPECHGCLDENWPIVSIWGAARLQKPEPPPSLRNQGIMWTEWGSKKVRKSKQESGRGPYGPARVLTISPWFLQHLQSEDVIFLRKLTWKTKFKGPMSLADAFDKYVFNA